jgi:haloalkane dehalogenase
MKITRHFITIGQRRVHYRKSGSGPTLLMVHQSPRNSAEYEPLMRKWGEHFTCIAPDTAGFGQSDPLTGNAEVGDFAAALFEFMDAVGIAQTAAYGFHSGATILVTALRRDPSRFTSIAVGGYAQWTAEEQEMFEEHYHPPFRPSAYGEHLTWVWNRMLEQSWFFPWFDVRDANRMPRAHDDVQRTHGWVSDMLDSGDAYRMGYGAVMRAASEIPDADEPTVPLLWAAYDGDPLQIHIERITHLPELWRTQLVKDPSDLEDVCLAHIQATPQPATPTLQEDENAGFIPVQSKGFDGLIHWQGPRGAASVLLHAPGRSGNLLNADDMLCIDLAGHGLSDDFACGSQADFNAFVDSTAAAIAALCPTLPQSIIGEGYSALLAAAVAQKLGVGSWGGVDAHIPADERIADYAARALVDITPDRHGSYLTKAWSQVRSSHYYWPWYEACAANAIPFDPADAVPDALAAEHLSLMRARSAPSLLAALSAVDRRALLASAPQLARWEQAAWASNRADIWHPAK